MNIKSILFRWYAAYKCPSILKEHIHANEIQNKTLIYLLRTADRTSFGRDHQMHNIEDYEDFCSYIPVRNYEDFLPYIQMMQEGEPDVLWKGKPLYYAMTSGTTAGVKYIPISRESIKHHIESARNVLLFYVLQNRQVDLFSGKMMFLQGSPSLNKLDDTLMGRLSGIVFHHVPAFFLKNRLPSYNVNIIEDWETKVRAIVGETVREDMTVLGGIPPWVIMYLEELSKVANKPIGEVFPNLALYVHGGVNFAPFKSKMRELLGKEVTMLDTFPASEGFFAYQNDSTAPEMLLNINAGIFYEFVELEAYMKDGALNPKRLIEVDLQVNYVLIITTNAGLWRYAIGDTVKFVSRNPYKILVTGRIKQFVSAFGEHVIAEEVDAAMAELMAEFKVSVRDFHVYPNVENKRHEWLIEWEEPIPHNLHEISKALDLLICKKNKYYRDLIEGSIIQPLQIISLAPKSFYNYYKSMEKLGGQNKVVRLSNDRILADKLRGDFE
ncbi:MAG: GH3 auxin-responsive promoter family protein [Chitinophagales bacterium]|nr:GH3 auxin-responsive promoter family protein [Chitinophagales bacterium]